MISKLLIRVVDKTAAAVATNAARREAIIAPGARLTRTGRIDNIARRRELVRIGEHSAIGGHLQVFAHAGRIVIGEWCFVGPGSYIWSAAEITIGDRVLISHGVNIIDTSSHPIDAAARFAQTEAILSRGHPRLDPGLESAPIHIGDDSWISFGACVLRGVTIGEGAIVGAASVVTKDVPAWTIVAGNPARIVRELDPTQPRLAV